MECILVFINLGTKPPCTWVRGEEGEGSSHPHSWLEEATDPRGTDMPCFFSPLDQSKLGVTECHTFECPNLSLTPG